MDDHERRLTLRRALVGDNTGLYMGVENQDGPVTNSLFKVWVDNEVERLMIESDLIADGCRLRNQRLNEKIREMERRGT